MQRYSRNSLSWYFDFLILVLAETSFRKLELILVRNIFALDDETDNIVELYFTFADQLQQKWSLWCGKDNIILFDNISVIELVF